MRVRAMPACNRDFCKTPAIRRHEADRSVNGFKIRIGSFPDFFPRQQIDRIERRHLDPEVVRHSAKRTDSPLLHPKLSSQSVRAVRGENTAGTFQTCDRATQLDQAAAHASLGSTDYAQSL